MDRAGAPSNDDYTELLETIQTGNRVKFESLCSAKLGLNPANPNDMRQILELWAAAVGTQTTEAQAAYPGSSGW